MHETRAVAGADDRTDRARSRPADEPERDDHTGWSDSSARSMLQLMVESVAEMVGFEVAALSVVLDGELITMAYAGPEEYREVVFANDEPVATLDPVLEHGEAWGRFRFLSHHSHQSDLDGTWIVIDQETSDDADGWHPHDVLVAFLCHDDGRLAGVLSLDAPTTGRLPDPATRSLLERYAAQAERAVVTAFEREEMVHQIAHAEAARRLVRSASLPAHASLDDVIRSTHAPLVEGFEAVGSWMQVLDADGIGRGYAWARDGTAVELSDAMHRVAHQLAPVLWRAERVLVLADGVEPGLPGEVMPAVAEVLREMEAVGVPSAIAVALGVGSECLGFLVLARGADDPLWTPVEADSAVQIGHDLGAALMTARALEGERGLVRELKQLDDYRSQLIATLSHELRTPLTVISGNLELLGDLDLDELATRLQLAMTKGASRMKKVVDDLLLLAEVSDPRHPLLRLPVDLRAVTRDVVALVESTARAKGLRLDVDFGTDALVVPGDAGELDRMIANLVSNAVKYTSDGGTVSVATGRRDSDLVLRVSDDGLGISEEDQVGLFRPFFRTTNPDALRHPGTGLGLTIVATIVERHGGTVAVDSRLGRGTTFTVVLPDAELAGADA